MFFIPAPSLLRTPPFILHTLLTITFHKRTIQHIVQGYNPAIFIIIYERKRDKDVF